MAIEPGACGESKQYLRMLGHTLDPFLTFHSRRRA